MDDAEDRAERRWEAEQEADRVARHAPMADEIPAARVVRRLAPGLFAVGDELHLDLPMFVASLGWDPADEKAQEMAIAAVASIAGEHGIPIEVTE